MEDEDLFSHATPYTINMCPPTPFPSHILARHSPSSSRVVAKNIYFFHRTFPEHLHLPISFWTV